MQAVRTASQFTGRQRRILRAMWALDALSKPVTTREISRQAKLPIGCISPTLRKMLWEVDRVTHRRGDPQWKLKNCIAGAL